MRIYLDTSCLMRPFDDRRQHRIGLEAEAVLLIVDVCRQGKLQLLNSEALQLELRRAKSKLRRAFAEGVLRTSVATIELDETIQNRASELQSLHGFTGLDALHVAMAEAGNADVPCTCDQRMLTKGSAIRQTKVRFATPLRLIEELN